MEACPRGTRKVGGRCVPKRTPKITKQQLNNFLKHLRENNLVIVDEHYPEHGDFYPTDEWIVENAVEDNIVD